MWTRHCGLLPVVCSRRSRGEGAHVRTLLNGIAAASPVSVSPHPRNQTLARAQSTSGAGGHSSRSIQRRIPRGTVNSAVSFYLVAPQGMLGSGARVKMNASPLCYKAPLQNSPPSLSLLPCGKHVCFPFSTRGARGDSHSVGAAMSASANQVHTVTDEGDERVRRRLLPPHGALATHHGRSDQRGSFP